MTCSLLFFLSGGSEPQNRNIEPDGNREEAQENEELRKTGIGSRQHHFSRLGNIQPIVVTRLYCDRKDVDIKNSFLKKEKE